MFAKSARATFDSVHESFAICAKKRRPTAWIVACHRLTAAYRMAEKLPQAAEQTQNFMISPTQGDTGTPTGSGNTEPADASKSSRTSLRVMAREAAREVESRIILNVLEHHHWNRRRTAEALKISYRSLMYKMKYCKLREDNPSGGSEMK